MDFHARYSATGKHYRYTILNRTAPSAIYKHTTYHETSSECGQNDKRAHILLANRISAALCRRSKIKKT